MFGKRIKELRKRDCMTQERLAELLAISPQAISRWETGIAMPDISLLAPLATIFHVTTDYLLGVDLEHDEQNVQRLIDVAKSIRVLEDDELLEKYRAEIKKHPDNVALKESFLTALQVRKFRAYTTDPDTAREVTELCESLLEEGSDRSDADLISIMSLAAPRIDNCERVKALSERLPSLCDSIEVILPRCTEGEERVNALKILIYESANQMIFALYDLFEEGEALSDADLTSLEDAIRVIELLYGAPFANRYISKEYRYSRVEYYLKHGTEEQAIRALEDFADVFADAFNDDLDLRFPSLIAPKNAEVLGLSFVVEETSERNQRIEKIQEDFSTYKDIRVQECIQKIEAALECMKGQKEEWLTIVSQYIMDHKALTKSSPESDM